MTQPFLTINETDQISLGQSLKYLQASGKLQTFLGDILRQHVIEQELTTRTDLDTNAGTVEQAVIDFRLKQNLTDPQAFQQWLDQNRLTYDSFHQQIAAGFQRESLKMAVVKPELEAYFQERKPFLDTVILSRIVVLDHELADSLHRMLQDGASFEQLAKEHSIAAEKAVNGMMGPISRATLPPDLKAQVDDSTPGEVIGPVQVEDKWCLFRVEQLIDVSFDDTKLRQKLQNELFERWVNEKLKTLTVKMQIGD
ncbi:MAG: peptidylprolyl isomerase [Oscillatoriales cyanobacterium RM1_1_9]|nr:peptidylprolyl isomerase [Oscillatoriales cyanobacterium SM2_3_0]NJO46048.1 peptidylprolyl isomerase [Oscillatoriales cyanobacterium RM2_1_1]NJO71966.1 peptidylprolyl isomerase [Oscillatoriales cyanobacterium RM1_1_9]